MAWRSSQWSLVPSTSTPTSSSRWRRFAPNSCSPAARRVSRAITAWRRWRRWRSRPGALRALKVRIRSRSARASGSSRYGCYTVFVTCWSRRVCSVCVSIVVARSRSHQAAVSNLSQECAMRIYVGNLSFNTEETQLEQLFTPLGEVNSVKLVRDHSTGRSRGFGFVEMTDDNQGRAACEALDQHEFEGRRLTVNEAKPQVQRGGYSGGGGGYAGGGGGRNRGESRW